jgi:hypothetical protein
MIWKFVIRIVAMSNRLNAKLRHIKDLDTKPNLFKLRLKVNIALHRLKQIQDSITDDILKYNTDETLSLDSLIQRHPRYSNMVKSQDNLRKVQTRYYKCTKAASYG